MISGGEANTNRGYASVIAGGRTNSVAALADNSVIAGRANNQIVGSQLLDVYGTIGGGQGNSMQTNAIYSTISGGIGNAAQTNAQYATIPGGASNSVAGNYSFAAGNRAGALHNGAFVWADSTAASFASTAANQFLIRAGGGVGIGTNNPTVALEVAGTVKAGAFQGNGSGLTNVSGGNIAPASVATAALSDNAVNSAKIADGSIVAGDVNAATFGTTFWKVNGNAGTTPAANFVGTTDNQPLEVKVNNLRGLRIEPNTNGAANIIGGSPNNFVDSGVVAATIGGGGAISRSGVSYTNRVTGDFGTVAGGGGNTSGRFSTTSGLGATAEGAGAVAMGFNVTARGDFGSLALGYACSASGASAKAIGYFSEAQANYATAMGSYSRALHPGSFVWADTQSPWFDSTANNQFSIRAAGGVRLNTDTSLFWGTGAKLWPDQGGAIELGNSLVAGGTPYLDFHYGYGSDEDYNVRLINDANGQLTLDGNQQISGNLGFTPGTRQMLNLYSAAYGIGVQSYRLYFRTDRAGWFRLVCRRHT